MSINLGDINFEISRVTPFAMTMHGEMVDELAREMNTFKSFSPNEKDARKLSVLNGQLVIGKEKNIFNTFGREAIYFMNQQRKIYVDFPVEKVVYHSSFLNENEDWPIAAGMLRAENGKLLKINADSGHFAPSNESVELVIERLNEKGAKINSKEVIEPPRTYSPVQRTPRASPLQNKMALEAKLNSSGKNTPSRLPSSSPPPVQAESVIPKENTLIKPLAIRGLMANRRILNLKQDSYTNPNK